MTERGHVIEQALGGLDAGSVEMVRELAEARVYPPDTVLCSEGQEEHRMYIIEHGRVVITQVLNAEEERILAYRGPGDYFGEMSLVTGQPRAATIKTVEETAVLEISREAFERVLSTSPTLARGLLRTVILNIREADHAALRDLRAQTEELKQAYDELSAAQAEIVAKERMERELEIAGEVQRSFLPEQLPDAPGFTFAARFLPARQVGGDVFDALALPDGTIALLLADVSDKGVHAALVMAVTRTLFRTEARRQPDPVAVVQAVHAGLVDVSASDMFVTAFYGVLNPDSGLLRYVRAGHDKPLWVRADGSAEFLGGVGRFLGMVPEPPIAEEQTVTLGRGDCLVVYSDGVTDMPDASGQPFGAENLQRAVVDNRALDAEGIAQAIHDSVDRHRGASEVFDDVTLLVVRAAD